MDGQFNTHSQALNNRIMAHDKYGSNDLNAWIFEHADIRDGNIVLDIGCGRGKQSFDISTRVGDSGKVTSVDLSEESIQFIEDQCKRTNISNIETHVADVDSFFAKLNSAVFDYIVSSYALYYTKDAKNVFSNIYDVLKDNGCLFFCGPSAKNNIELKEMHYSIKGTDVPDATFATKFMEEESIVHLKNIFGNYELYEFENPLVFDSSDALYNYWSSYNLYDEKIDAHFKDYTKSYFEKNNSFVTVKRVVGIKAIKG